MYTFAMLANRWTRGFRVLGLAAVLTLLLVTALLVVLYLEPVQRAVGRQLLDRAAAAIGWDLQAVSVRVRVWPGLIVAEDVHAGPPEGEVVAAERVEVRFSWRELLGDPPRVELVAVWGLEFHQPPERDEPTADRPTPGEILQMVEVERLQVHGARGALDFDGIAVSTRGAEAGAELLGGAAGAVLQTERLVVERDGRPLDLGRVRAEVRAEAGALVVEAASMTGGEIEGEVAAEVLGAGWDESVVASASVDTGAGEILEWWDPELAERLQLGGRAAGTFKIWWQDGAPLRLQISAQGRGATLADLPVDEATFTLDGERLAVEASSARWGRFSAFSPGGERWELAGDLERASLEVLRGFVPPDLAARIPAGATATGAFQLTLAPPVGVDTMSGRAALAVHWPNGRMLVEGSGEAGGFAFTDARVEVPGLALQARGGVTEARARELSVELRSDTVERLLDVVRQWLPDFEAPPITGGPIYADLELDGPWADVSLSGGLLWGGGTAYDLPVERAAVFLDGHFSALEWDGVAALVGGGTVSGDGQASLTSGTAEGTFDLADAPAAAVARLVMPEVADLVGGLVQASGSFRLAEGVPELEVAFVAQCPLIGSVAGGLLTGDVRLTEAGLQLTETRLELPEGNVCLTGTIGFAEPSPELDLVVSWGGVRLGELLPDVPPQLAGELCGRAVVDGTIADPVAFGTAEWRPLHPDTLVGPVEARFSLLDGVVELLTDTSRTDAGPLVLWARLGLGSVPGLAETFPAAPADGLVVRASSPGVDVDSLMTAVGVSVPGVAITTGLELDGRWSLEPGTWPTARIELPGFQIATETEEVTTEAPPVVSVHEGRVELEPVVFRGPRSRAVAEGWADLRSEQLRLAVEGAVAPGLLEVALAGFSVRAPLEVDAVVEGSFSAPTGRITLDHTGGAIVLRDPPVEIADLHLEAEVEAGALSITAGSARLNRGTLFIGGGWDPEVQQGVVLEMEDVSALLPMGILTRWDGLVAVEPRAGDRVAVVGELFLQSGLWDQDVDLARMLADQLSGETAAAVNPVMDQVSLDLDVYGRGGIEVDNNIGAMLVQWRALHVGGTLASPAIAGELRVAQGGELHITGEPVEIQRGRIEFTGAANEAPTVELVTVRPLIAGGGGVEQVNLTDLVQAGAVSAVGQALGIQPTNLRPVEIAAETNSDVATRFMVAQWLGPNAVLFLSTDLADVQERTTLLQLWRFDFLKGLVLQAFSSTAEGEGGAIFERYRWGGTEEEEEGPTVGKVRLAGEWPVSKRAIKRALSIRRGATYDPFLLFVGEVQAERALAARGYPEARVRGEVTGEERKRLVFDVEPGPHVVVEFAGDDVPRKLRRQVTAQYRTGWLEAAALGNMRELLEQELAARGYPEARVEVERLPERVVVQVTKGPELELEVLEVEGVPVETARLVSELMGTPAQIGELLERDPEAVARLRGLLMAEGYPDPEVVEITAIPTEDEAARVVVRVQVGPRETVRDLDLQGEDPLGVLAQPQFPLREGTPLRRRVLDVAEHALRLAYRESGYLDVRVAIVEPGDAGRVLVRLEPGRQRRVTRIEVSGLRHLDQEVVDEAILVAEGDVLRPSDLDEIAARLGGFAPVDRVEVDWQPDGPSGALVEVRVWEKPRWTVGGGYRHSSEFGGEAVVDLRDDNLLGRGYKANARGRWGSEVEGAYLFLERPPQPGGDRAYFASLTYERQPWESDLTRSEITASLELQLREVGETQWRAYLRAERVHLFEEDPDFIAAIDSTTDTVSIGGVYALDTRDHPFDPTSGYYLAMDLRYSPEWLGSDLQLVRSLATGSLVLEPREGWTWAQMLRIGIADPFGGFLPREVRFYAGGESSIRGFDRNSVGPEICTVDGCTPLGGGAILLLNQELRVPVLTWMDAAAFVDAGQVWEDWSKFDLDLAVGGGVGVRVDTPVGTLRGDVAWPLLNRQGNRGAEFYIGLGQVF